MRLQIHLSLVRRIEPFFTMYISRIHLKKLNQMDY